MRKSGIYLKADDGNIILFDESRSNVRLLIRFAVNAADDRAESDLLDAGVDVHHSRESRADDGFIVDNHHLDVKDVRHLFPKCQVRSKGMRKNRY